MPKTIHCINWSAGAGAQLEVFSPDPEAVGGGNYRLRYIPPFRATIRPPSSALQFGDAELRKLVGNLDALAQQVADVATRGPADPAKSPSVTNRDSKAELTGQMLFDSVVPRSVAADLRTPNLFVDLGVDDALVQYPWELMHDGADFLCLRHYLGRFVNSSTVAQISQLQTPTSPIGQLVEKLSILIISVPRPDARPGSAPLRNLPGAEKETQKILDALQGVEGVEVKLLANKDAEFDNVYSTLKAGPYHIIHYVGHATFDTRKPHASALVLKDADMTTGNICNYFGARPPVICFVNACDSGKAVGWGANYNIYGLAQAFLTTGSYLIGSRWNLEDDPAADFAADFYTQLIKEQKPIGEALMQARVKSRAAWKDSFAWASYVYYGDPRVYFRRTLEPN